ncbi:MAG: hypothetical protein HC840_05660 [Leptolyngbyaceae cyanobacterium RM2_2_4]|nr:hypothetical protein [Leptolyngbyaceae cyanobacterium RM2_2_4]
MQRSPEVAASWEGEPSIEETAEPEADQAVSQPAVDPPEQTNLNQLWQEVLNYLQLPPLGCSCANRVV